MILPNCSWLYQLWKSKFDKQTHISWFKMNMEPTWTLCSVDYIQFWCKSVHWRLVWNQIMTTHLHILDQLQAMMNSLIQGVLEWFGKCCSSYLSRIVTKTNKMVCVRPVKIQIYPLSAQQRLWSDWVMPRLICVSAWCTCHFVGFVTMLCIYFSYILLLDKPESPVLKKIPCYPVSRSWKNGVVWIFLCILIYLLLKQGWILHYTKKAISLENLFMPYANNKDTDQPAHPRSLISVFVIRCLDCIMPLVSISKCSSL